MSDKKQYPPCGMCDGAYGHGFLLAPVLENMVRDYLTAGAHDPRMFTVL
jgi:hypothetical protein